MDLMDVVQWINNFYGMWINKLMDVGFRGFFEFQWSFGGFWFSINFQPLLATK